MDIAVLSMEKIQESAAMIKREQISPPPLAGVKTFAQPMHLALDSTISLILLLQTNTAFRYHQTLAVQRDSTWMEMQLCLLQLR